MKFPRLYCTFSINSTTRIMKYAWVNKGAELISTSSSWTNSNVHIQDPMELAKIVVPQGLLKTWEVVSGDVYPNRPAATVTRLISIFSLKRIPFHTRSQGGFLINGFLGGNQRRDYSCKNLCWNWLMTCWIHIFHITIGLVNPNNYQAQVLVTAMTYLYNH